MELFVRNLGKSITVAPGEMILSPLRSLGVSYSCEDGRCGMCRCQLIRGEVIEHIPPPRRTFGCKVRYVLACQTSLAENATIVIPEVAEPKVLESHRIKATVTSLTTLSDNVMELVIKPARPLKFEPGQCIEIELTRGLSRLYSMANADEGDELSFHVRIHPHGRASHIIKNVLKVGNTVRIRGPYGSSYLRRHHCSPILIASAGTGLAPVLSILGAISNNTLMNPVHVYVGFMTSEEAYALDALRSLLANIPTIKSWHIMVASGPIGRGQRRGLLTEAIDSDFDDLARFRAHAFGSPYAIDALVQLFRRKGIDDSRLYVDSYHSLWN